MRTAKRLVLGLAVAAAMLAVAEGALRLVLGPPPPPPVAKRVLDQALDGITVSGGMAAAPHSEDRFPVAAAWPRVAALGGSSVRGGTPMLRPEQEFPAIAGSVAQVDTLNLAWPGYDSRNVLAQAQLLSAWDFSALVVYTGHNDYGNLRFGAAFSSGVPGRLAELRLAMSHLQLFHAVGALSAKTRGDRQYDGLPPLDEEDIRRAATGLEANLRALVGVCREADIAVVLVTPVRRLTLLPEEQPCTRGEPCARALYRDAMALRGSQPEEAGRLLREARDADRRALSAPSTVPELVRDLGSEPGVMVVDAEASLPRESGMDVPADRLFHDGLHLSAEGHRAMGVLVGQTLRGLLWQECVVRSSGFAAGAAGRGPPPQPPRGRPR